MNISMRSSVYTALLSAAFISAPLIAAADTTFHVSVADNSFTEKTITISRGDTVTWTHNGTTTMQHTVTADDASFDSGILNPGQIFSRRFNATGTFPYHCAFHGAAGGIGMAGVVIVTSDSSPGPSQESSNNQTQACTRDAHQCPDGSTVGRTGPRCEFVCPTHTPASTTPDITINEANAQLNVLLDAFKDIQRKILALIVSMKQGASTAVDFTQIQTLLDQVRLVQEKFIVLRLSIDSRDGDHGNCGRGHEGDCIASPNPSADDDSSNTADGGHACTRDAKVCPDGSSVGRTGPHCEFICSAHVTPSPVITSCPVISRTLSHGNSGNDVKQLQQFLAQSDGDFPISNVTGFFGNATKAALGRWQMNHGFVADSAAGGVVGPRTREWLRNCRSANFTASPTSGSIPLTVTFSVRVRSSIQQADAGGAFGGTGAGTGGAGVSTVAVIGVNNDDIAVDSSVTRESGDAGPPLKADEIGTIPPSSSPSFTVDFGDGSTELVPCVKVGPVAGTCIGTLTHTYTSAGTYTAVLLKDISQAGISCPIDDLEGDFSCMKKVDFATITVRAPQACIPRPACLDATPRCLPPEPAAGWCPVNPPPGCTRDAKICPDGSSVGRTGPNCSFAACPVHGIVPGGTGVTGTVLLGPTCPVVQNPPDPQCADKPFATSLAVTTADGSKIVKTFSSDANGAFKIALLPGTYAITSAGTQVLPRCSSNGSFTVKSGVFIKVAVSCDSGIR